ncbi:prevent-host-death family protein [Sphingomonas vulcanisoli]|uniref:Antitoxin n=1 Tax=Sphingomonas vulcanisoli TaxID=1658060 RepID=A0ABX0TNH7_9SPHN|nr:type II toxin-antitoxin system prevent-host-death family antitoxin [Sphingomonas vulcanisoli]NIJ07072.1 prevent-host-death family protein [Sphingomonas vulcanisoli]
MHISVTNAKAQLTDLVRRVEEGDEVILTRHGHPAAKIVPIEPVSDEQSILAAIKAVQMSVAAMGIKGIDAARSQDFLYDEHGLPA